MPDSHDTTVDYPRQDPGRLGSPYRDSFVPDHRIVASFGSESSEETRRLLQQRLRAACIVLVVGFGLFFIRALFLHRLESLTVLFHALLLGLLILSLSLLSSSWQADAPRAAYLRGGPVRHGDDLLHGGAVRADAALGAL